MRDNIQYYGSADPFDVGGMYVVIDCWVSEGTAIVLDISVVDTASATKHVILTSLKLTALPGEPRGADIENEIREAMEWQGGDLHPVGMMPGIVPLATAYPGASEAELAKLVRWSGADVCTEAVARELVDAWIADVIRETGDR